MNAQSKRRVEPKEARESLFLPSQQWAASYCRALADTVATEPDRTRAAVVKALRFMAEVIVCEFDKRSMTICADAVENGADW